MTVITETQKNFDFTIIQKIIKPRSTKKSIGKIIPGRAKYQFTEVFTKGTRHTNK
jgi:hypothetical protein